MRILTCEIEDNPGLDFKRHAEAVADIIVNSEPQFSVDIYGDWGTGKTTLMHLVRGMLLLRLRVRMQQYSPFQC
jgi:ABC-type lipoprotein export system ATPase subunit